MISEIICFITTQCSYALPFKNQQLMKDYQARWITLFEEVLTNPLENELHFKFQQCYIVPVKISHFLDLEIQIDIKALIEMIKKDCPPFYPINLENFINSSSFHIEKLNKNRNLITYNLDFSFKKVSKEPIIVCLSDITPQNFVLDGNHRVDFAINNHFSTIEAYVISSKSLIYSPHLFVDRVSYLLFCFLEDLALLQNALFLKQSKGVFGILRTESSLLKNQSILEIVEENIFGTSH